MAVSAALGMRMAIFTLATGVVAAIALPFVISVTAQIAIDQEIALPTVVLAIAFLFNAPLLGSIPGLFAIACGIAALANRRLRIPFAMAGTCSNLVAVLLLVLLVAATLGPLYTYREV